MKNNNANYLIIGIVLSIFGTIAMIAGVIANSLPAVLIAYVVALIIGLFLIHKSLLEKKQSEYDSYRAEFEPKLKAVE